MLFAGRLLARVGLSYTALDDWVALANGRVRYPSWNFTLSVTAGRFRDQDQGVAIDLSRFCGDTEKGTAAVAFSSTVACSLFLCTEHHGVY